IPPEPSAELGPHAPSGFTAPLPGGPYVASTMNGPAGSANYTLYISSDVIIVAGHSDRPAILRGVEGIKTQDSGRTRIDNQYTSIVVANGTTGSSFVAVAGPETARRQII